MQINILGYLATNFSSCDKFYIGLQKNKKGWNWPLETIAYGKAYANWKNGNAFFAI